MGSELYHVVVWLYACGIVSSVVWADTSIGHLIPPEPSGEGGMRWPVLVSAHTAQETDAICIFSHDYSNWHKEDCRKTAFDKQLRVIHESFTACTGLLQPKNACWDIFLIKQCFFHSVFAPVAISRGHHPWNTPLTVVWSDTRWFLMRKCTFLGIYMHFPGKNSCKTVFELLSTRLMFFHLVFTRVARLWGGCWW